MLVDSHCHLDRLKLDQCGGSVATAIAAARDAGVSHFLCVCISAANKDAVLDIANSDPSIFASVGIHPSDVTDTIIVEDELGLWADHPKVVAIGETGLDYHYSKDTADAQVRSFAAHLRAGARLDLPVIVHSRAAQEDTLACIKEHGSSASAGVMHCFTESWEMARAALDLNYYISLSGIVTFKNADELRDVARKVPLDRLLVETDSPYLAPVPHRGRSNEPKFVIDVARFIAELRGISYEELAEKTSENFFRLFRRAVRTGV